MALSISNTWYLVRTKWETDWRIERQADGWTERHRNRVSEPYGTRQKKRDRQTEGQTDRQRGRPMQLLRSGIRA